MIYEPSRKSIEDESTRILEAFLRRYRAPAEMKDVVPLLDVSAKLVETAAFSAASMIDKDVVVELIQIAAQLEAQAVKLRGMPHT